MIEVDSNYLTFLEDKDSNQITAIRIANSIREGVWLHKGQEGT